MDDIARHIKQGSVIRRVKKGTNIIFQGEIPRRAFIVRDGLVRAYTITSTGEECIVGLYGKGDIAPISWLLNQASNALFYYDAIVDTRVLMVSKTNFTDEMTRNSELKDAVMAYLSNLYTASLIRITGLEQPKAIEKVAYILYYLLFRYGIETKQNVYVVDLKLSHLMIANLIGITRESTTMNLRLLKEKGVIDYNRTTYTLYKSKLESFIGEDSFRDVKLSSSLYREQF